MRREWNTSPSENILFDKPLNNALMLLRLFVITNSDKKNIVSVPPDRCRVPLLFYLN